MYIIDRIIPINNYKPYRKKTFYMFISITIQWLYYSLISKRKKNVGPSTLRLGGNELIVARESAVG